MYERDGTFVGDQVDHKVGERILIEGRQFVITEYTLERNKPPTVKLVSPLELIDSKEEEPS